MYRLQFSQRHCPGIFANRLLRLQKPRSLKITLHSSPRPQSFSSRKNSASRSLLHRSFHFPSSQMDPGPVSFMIWALPLASPGPNFAFVYGRRAGRNEERQGQSQRPDRHLRLRDGIFSYLLRSQWPEATHRKLSILDMPTEIHSHYNKAATMGRPLRGGCQWIVIIDFRNPAIWHQTGEAAW